MAIVIIKTMKFLLYLFITIPLICLGQWSIPTKMINSEKLNTAINPAIKGVLVFKKVDDHIMLELTDVNITEKTKKVEYKFIFYSGSTEAKTNAIIPPDKERIILEPEFETKSYLYYFKCCEKLMITINDNESYVFDMSNIYTAYQFVTK